MTDDQRLIIKALAALVDEPKPYGKRILAELLERITLRK